MLVEVEARVQMTTMDETGTRLPSNAILTELLLSAWHAFMENSLNEETKKYDILERKFKVGLYSNFIDSLWNW